MREASDSRSCWKVPGAHTLLMSEGDERFHIKNGLKRKRLEISVKKSAGKGSRPPRSESDGDLSPTINFCDGL